jgi:hypothetical protein
MVIDMTIKDVVVVGDELVFLHGGWSMYGSNCRALLLLLCSIENKDCVEGYLC